MWGFFRRGRSPTFFCAKHCSAAWWLGSAEAAWLMLCRACFVLFCKQGLFASQTRLLCVANKASLHCKQGFFALQTRLLFKRI